MAKKTRKRAGEPSRSVNAPDPDVEDAEVGDGQEPLGDQREADLEDTDEHEALNNNQEVHGNGNGSVGIASWANAIEGASIFPTIHNRVPTATEWEHLKAYVISNEEDVLLHEEKCRVCHEPLKPDTMEGIRHYREHNIKFSCPYCDQDWTGKNSKAQRQHLQEDHRDNIHSLEPEICPYSGCTVDLADRAAFPSLVEVTRHTREHIDYSDRDDFCQYPGCHANIGHMSDQMRGEHEGMHKQSPPAARSTQMKGKKSGRHTQGTQTTAASADLERQNLVNANQPTAGPSGAGVDNRIQTEQANAPYVPDQPNEREILYCTICWKAQGSKGPKAQENHAAGCNTKVQDFVSLTQNDAKRERDNRKNGKTKAPEKSLAEVSNSSTGQSAVAAGFIAKIRQTPASDAEVLAQDPPHSSPVETSKDLRTKKPEVAAAADELQSGEGPQTRKTRSRGTKQARPAAAVGATEPAEEPPVQKTQRKRAKRARPAAAVGAMEPAEEIPTQETHSRRTKQARPAATAEGTQSNKAPPAPKTRNKRVKESAPAAAADVAASAQQPPSQRGRRGRRTSSNTPAADAENAEGSNSTTTEHAEQSPRAQRARNRAAPDPSAEEAPAPSKPKLKITHNAARPGRT